LLETAQSLRKRPLLRPVTGNDVMKLCDVDAGEDVGRILREVEERVLEGRIVNRRQALAYLRTRKTAP
ncbi:MAG: hypothetical protein OEV00_06680, partial [Acidobacteriota bacterium]|nr:hypothetical protein [Acidobacteriota bacterium]